MRKMAVFQKDAVHVCYNTPEMAVCVFVCLSAKLVFQKDAVHV